MHSVLVQDFVSGRLFCEITASQLIAIKIHSDTGSQNRILEQHTMYIITQEYKYLCKIGYHY